MASELMASELMASESTAVGDGQTELITFVESYRPPIVSGLYTLTVEQAMTEVDPVTRQEVANPRVKSNSASIKTVAVQGERFAIDPADITSVFPPDRSQGEHSNVLPHIVFSRKTLPWERESGVPLPNKPAPANTPAATPWLALLIFHDDDPAPKIQPAMIGDLLRDPFSPAPPESRRANRSSTLIDAENHGAQPVHIATYADAVTGWKREYGQHVWDPCRVVDVPVDLFRAIAPSQEDLGWLAHSRHVSAGGMKQKMSRNQNITAAAEEETQPGDFSVIIANRLPKSNGVSTACLVSLEHLATFLPCKTQQEPDIKVNGIDATHVRLVVLKTWSFTCPKLHETFRGFFDNLHYGPLQLPYHRPTEGSEYESTVESALNMGYTALDHDTRWGDHMISWYRGPFLPFASPVPAAVPWPAIADDGAATGSAPISTADEAVRYDPDLGMLDVSYAAAWQLGRLMAMRDKSFSYALYQWKQENTRKTHLAAQRQALQLLRPHLASLQAGADGALGALPFLRNAEVRNNAFETVAGDLLASILLNTLDGKDHAK